MATRTQRLTERRRGVARAGPRSREDVVDAAARAFARRGYRDTTMRDVAAELGVTPGALYSYFESKESLFAAAAERMRGHLVEAIEAPMPSGMSFEQEVELLLLRLFELTERYRGELAAFLDAPALGVAERVGAPRSGFDVLRTRIAAWFARPARRAVLRCDPEIAATSFTGMTIALMRVRVMHPDSEELVPMAPSVRDLFVRGACCGGTQ